MIARSATTPMVSVYDGRACLGFILARGRADFEAFDSSHRVLAPAQVLACEVFRGRDWRHATNSGGVAVEVGHLRSRALVERRGGAS
jgi:hypothetical protein